MSTQRLCKWCESDIPKGRASTAMYCSKRCRDAFNNFNYRHKEGVIQSDSSAKRIRYELVPDLASYLALRGFPQATQFIQEKEASS